MTKICNGPAHPNATALPLTDDNWYFHKTGPKTGLPLSRCKLCVNWSRLQSTGQSGTIDCSKVFKFVEELVLRYDRAEIAARETGVAATTLRSIMRKDHCTIQKRTALKIIAALDNKRREDRRKGTMSQSYLRAVKARVLREERFNHHKEF